MVSAEVCSTRRRGRYPSRAACCATEKAPVMTDCEAITVAAAARTTRGSCAQPGASRKNGLAMLATGLSRISAPWPM